MRPTPLRPPRPHTVHLFALREFNRAGRSASQSDVDVFLSPTPSTPSHWHSPIPEMPSSCIALRLPPLPPAAHVRMSVAFTAGVAWQSDSGLSASWSLCNDERAAAADEHIHAALLAARLLCLRATRWSGAQVTRLSEVAATNARVQSVGSSQAQRRVVAAASPAQSAASVPVSAASVPVPPAADSAAGMNPAHRVHPAHAFSSPPHSTATVPNQPISVQSSIIPPPPLLSHSLRRRLQHRSPPPPPHPPSTSLPQHQRRVRARLRVSVRYVSFPQ